MQDDGGHDIPGAHGGLEPGIAVREGNIGELVKHQPHRNRQAASMHLVRLIVQLLEGLRIQHTHQEIQGGVVAVRDDAEHRLLPFPQLPQLHGVPAGDPLDLRQGEGGQPDGGGNEDAHGRLAGGLLEHLVLAEGDMVRVFFLQSLKEQIQG